jgi:tRNA(Arg) A34 adenosine deaminase TadA
MAPPDLTDADLRHLRRCVELARAALDAGDAPFGSVLAAADGRLLAEERNREVTSGDRTQHPEFALARWAATNVAPEERACATVFTSGEHCAMCSAAHGWAGLGRIVYITSAAQFAEVLADLGVPPAPVRSLPIQDVVPGIAVVGPVPELVVEVQAMQRQFWSPARPER